MEILTSRGIVLSHRSVGEGDVISPVITEKSGIQRLMFRGLRKSRRRSHNAAEPGSFINFTIYSHPGRDISIPSEFSAVDDISAIRNDLEKLLVLLFLLETTEKTIAPGEDTGMIYRLLITARSSLLTSPYPLQLALVFVLHSMKFHGILPDFKRCGKCGRDDFVRFIPDAADFHPVCDRCARNTDKLLEEDALRLLRDCLAMRFNSLPFESYKADSPILLLRHLVMFIQGHYGISLRTTDFLYGGITG